MPQFTPSEYRSPARSVNPISNALMPLTLPSNVRTYLSEHRPFGCDAHSGVTAQSLRITGTRPARTGAPFTCSALPGRRAGGNRAGLGAGTVAPRRVQAAGERQ
jgi:hypothetical protein